MKFSRFQPTTRFVVLWESTLWEISYPPRTYATIPGKAGNPASSGIDENYHVCGLCQIYECDRSYNNFITEESIRMMT